MQEKLTLTDDTYLRFIRRWYFMLCFGTWLMISSHMCCQKSKEQR